MRGKGKWTIVESSEFQHARATYLSDVEFDAVKELVPRHPEKWIALTGGPGLFALHWGVKAPITIVFIIALERKKIYFIGIEVGIHHAVTEGVKRKLPHYWKALKDLGIRVAAWDSIRRFVRWIMDDWDNWF